MPCSESWRTLRLNRRRRFREMDPTLILAIIGTIVAFASYFVSYRSADKAGEAVHEARRAADSAQDSAESARRANDIAQHAQRLEIYKALQQFHMSVLTKAANFPEADIWPFFNAVNLSEFYFPHDVYAKLTALVDQAMTVKAAYSLFEMHRDNHAQQQTSAAILTANSETKRLRDLLAESDLALRSHLRLQPAAVPV